MSEREEVERRQKKGDRRQGERRLPPSFICDKCGADLIYFMPSDPQPKEYRWCDHCKQIYVVLKMNDGRNQIARIENVS